MWRGLWSPHGLDALDALACFANGPQVRYLAPVALRKLQDGTRGTVVVYHLTSDLDARVKEAAEGWTVYNETFPPGKNAYYTPSDLSALPSPLVLVGFSEGCQGVRANLLKRILPAACIAIDGIHAALDVGNNVPVWQQQIEPWLEYGKECAASELIPPPLFFVTHSAIQTTGYLSTTQALPHYLPDIASYETQPGDDGSTVSYPTFRVGPTKDYVPIMVWGYPGKDAAAHVFQATNVLPMRIRDMCNPGKVLSLPPVKPPAGGGGTKPPPLPPVGPVKPVTPAPPVPGPVKPVASTNSGQGLVTALAAMVTIGAVVASGRKK